MGAAQQQQQQQPGSGVWAGRAAVLLGCSEGRGSCSQPELWLCCLGALARRLITLPEPVATAGRPQRGLHYTFYHKHKSNSYHRFLIKMCLWRPCRAPVKHCTIKQFAAPAHATAQTSPKCPVEKSITSIKSTTNKSSVAQQQALFTGNISATF